MLSFIFLTSFNKSTPLKLSKLGPLKLELHAAITNNIVYNMETNRHWMICLDHPTTIEQCVVKKLLNNTYLGYYLLLFDGCRCVDWSSTKPTNYERTRCLDWFRAWTKPKHVWRINLDRFFPQNGFGSTILVHTFQFH